ncbi:MAG: SusD/RagB family nutrient-binding outer membrane lipoprotein [Flavitalea sp.]
MKIRDLLPILSMAALSLLACSKNFETFEENPNRPVTVPPNLVLTGVMSDLNSDRPWSLISRWNQFDNCNYNYYGDQRYDWTGASLNYLTLKNVLKMEEEAIRVGNKELNVYSALGKFLRAFYFYRMTNLVGDIPMSESLKGLDIQEPKYDSQKEVYLQIFNWLEEANNDFATLITEGGDSKIDGDIYFNNKSSWRRVINAFRLRALVSLSKKAADGDLRISQQFNEILSNPSKYPLLEGSDDDLQYIYNNINKYPSNPDNLGFDATRYNMSATYLNKLVDLNDPRAFITAEPATSELRNGKTPADITAYVGAPSGEDLAAMSSKMADATDAGYSVRSRSRYYANYAGEPGRIISYPEMCFNIAEAINRGWITGDAESWYKKGVKAALEFYGVPVNAAGSITKVYPFGSSASQSYTIPFDFENSYYTQSEVKYSGNNAQGLEQILTQKYLSFFQNSGWEAYFNYRRTGIPEFSVGTGTGNSGRIPLRFQYPSNEQTINKSNWTSAIQSQFGGSDDINAQMWLLK